MKFWIFGKKRDDRKIEDIHQKVSESFSRVKNEFEKVGGWIKHLDEHKQKHHHRLEDLENRLLLLENAVHGSERNERSSIQSFNRVQSRSIQSFMNVQSLSELSDKITPKEKKVILCLLEAKMPLEYADLAKKLGVSIVTTRRHINDIKKVGFSIEEKMNVDTKRKVFFIRNEVKRSLLRKSESLEIAKDREIE